MPAAQRPNGMVVRSPDASSAETPRDRLKREMAGITVPWIKAIELCKQQTPFQIRNVREQRGQFGDEIVYTIALHDDDESGICFSLAANQFRLRQAELIRENPNALFRLEFIATEFGRSSGYYLIVVA